MRMLGAFGLIMFVGAVVAPNPAPLLLVGLVTVLVMLAIVEERERP
jgi:hypothetical protein